MDLYTLFLRFLVLEAGRLKDVEMQQRIMDEGVN
jgi:hypothetical protein